MEIIIKGSSKEIAEFVVAIQTQLGNNELSTAENKSCQKYEDLDGFLQRCSKMLKSLEDSPIILP